MIKELLFHILAFGGNGYGLYYDLFVVKYPETEFMWHHPFGGHFKFLTTQNMLIQTVYFLIALLNDLIGTNEADVLCNLPKIRLIKDYYFSSLSFPMAVFVTYQFWSLYFYKREAVMPPIFFPVIPRWFNHLEHTFIVVWASLEMIICFRAYPDLSTGLTILYTYVIAYLIWLHIVKYVAGFWVYNVFNELTPKQRNCFLFVVAIIVLFIYLLGELINNGVWSKELRNIRYWTRSTCTVGTQVKDDL